MLALLFLALLLAWGLALSYWLLPDLPDLLRWRGERRELLASSPYFWLLRLPLALLLAVLPSTPLIYLLYSLCAHLLPRPEVLALPLAAGSWALAAVLHSVYLLRGALRRHSGTAVPMGLSPRAPNVGTAGARRSNGLPLLCFSLLALGACWLLFYYPLNQEGALIYAGSSVVSDYSAHIGLISSFSRGLNPYPSSYPFFAGAGLRYHFYFYFFTAILDRLGLGLVGALNLVSSLGLLAYLGLLGFTCWRLSLRRWSLLLAPPLFLWQPALRAWELARDYYAGRVQAPSLLLAYWQNRSFLGHGPHDDWGLWNLNVWANQRHFLWGLALALLVILLLTPWLRRSSRRLGLLVRWAGPGSWRLGTETLGPQNRPLPALYLLLLPAAYWHGSVLLALLLACCLLWLYLRDKGRLLLLGLCCLGLSLLQNHLFAGPSQEIQAAALQPRWHWGFLLEQPGLVEISGYLLATLGLALPLLFLLPLIQPRRSLALLASLALLPLMLCCSLSLTPDITVNHKWLILSRLWILPFWAAALSRLWAPASEQLRRRPQARSHSGLALRLRQGLALLLLLASCSSGLLDQLAYLRKNAPDQRFGLRTDAALVSTLQHQTPPQALFLTPAWHYHPFFYSGRLSFLGYSYFPWSAGYDSFGRDAVARWLYAGCGGQAQEFLELCRRWGIAYICVDEGLRQELGPELDEGFIRQHCQVLAHFPEQAQLSIYVVPSS